jgi:hypothetical protein
VRQENTFLYLLRTHDFLGNCQIQLHLWVVYGIRKRVLDLESDELGVEYQSIHFQALQISRLSVFLSVRRRKEYFLLTRVPVRNMIDHLKRLDRVLIIEQTKKPLVFFIPEC